MPGWAIYAIAALVLFVSGWLLMKWMNKREREAYVKKHKSPPKPRPAPSEEEWTFSSEEESIPVPAPPKPSRPSRPANTNVTTNVEGVWPEHGESEDFDVNPRRGIVYVSPPFVLADGNMFARIYVYAETIQGEPAVNAPFFFVDGNNFPILSGEVGVPGLMLDGKADRYPWNNNPGEMAIAVLIEADEDEGYEAYTTNGARLDENGEWEGTLRLAFNANRHEDITLGVKVNERVLHGPDAYDLVRFRSATFFEDHEDLKRYWPDRITETQFERLAREARARHL